LHRPIPQDRRKEGRTEAPTQRHAVAGAAILAYQPDQLALALGGGLGAHHGNREGQQHQPQRRLSIGSHLPLVQEARGGRAPQR
jgi:hypothetical protein